MKILMKIELPVETVNAAMKKGTFAGIMQSILDEQKPEAAYFTTSNGKRSGLLVIDLKDASKIPEFAEPWFAAFNASVEMSPAMVPSDLAKAGPDIERVMKKYS